MAQERLLGEVGVGEPQARGRRLPVRLGLMLLASVAVYVPGVLWLAYAKGLTLGAAFTLGAVPFLVGDICKSLAATILPSRHA